MIYVDQDENSASLSLEQTTSHYTLDMLFLANLLV